MKAWRAILGLLVIVLVFFGFVSGAPQPRGQRGRGAPGPAAQSGEAHGGGFGAERGDKR